MSVDESTNSTVTRDLDAMQLEVADILDHYTRADGTINRSRVEALLRDIRPVEEEHSNVLFNGTVDGMDVAAGTVVAYLLANVFSGGTQKRLDAMEDIALKRWLNDMSLMDRTQIVSGDYGDALRTTIRTGVYRNQTPADILQSVRDVHKAEQWKVDRIVTSEINNTYRMQFGTTANANGDGYVQFYESEWCTSRNHHKHRCHILANEDRYGKGKGVFKWDDLEIYAPHPQCRGFLGTFSER